ncbi:MAG: hypothetical protein ACRDNF_07265 [Streptosporangiaceae bacterium]
MAISEGVGVRRGWSAVSGLTVRVWRRYGQVRLYVAAADREVGWYDPRTGRFALAEPALAAEFWTVALAECDALIGAGKLAGRVLPSGSGEPGAAGPSAGSAGAGGSPGSTTAARRPGVIGPVQIPPSESVTTGQAGPQSPAEAANGHWLVRDPQWEDLANSGPGSAAHAHAVELRRRHPVLSALARLFGVRTSEQAFAQGARGERVIGRKLNRWAAASGWHVLHAIRSATAAPTSTTWSSGRSGW